MALREKDLEQRDHQPDSNNSPDSTSPSSGQKSFKLFSIDRNSSLAESDAHTAALAESGGENNSMEVMSEEDLPADDEDPLFKPHLPTPTPISQFRLQRHRIEIDQARDEMRRIGRIRPPRSHTVIRQLDLLAMRMEDQVRGMIDFPSVTSSVEVARALLIDLPMEASAFVSDVIKFNGGLRQRGRRRTNNNGS